MKLMTRRKILRTLPLVNEFPSNTIGKNKNINVNELNTIIKHYTKKTSKLHLYLEPQAYI